MSRQQLNGVSEETPPSDTSRMIGSQAKANASDGTVVGALRLWLQLEGATLLVGSLVASRPEYHGWFLSLGPSAWWHSIR